MTFFIIIGIILLLIIGTYAALRSQVQQEVVVSPEYIPLKQFVDTCIRESAQEALVLAGQNGGFLSLPGALDNPLLFLHA